MWVWASRMFCLSNVSSLMNHAPLMASVFMTTQRYDKHRCPANSCVLYNVLKIKSGLFWWNCLKLKLLKQKPETSSIDLWRANHTACCNKNLLSPPTQTFAVITFQLCFSSSSAWCLSQQWDKIRKASSYILNKDWHTRTLNKVKFVQWCAVSGVGE